MATAVVLRLLVAAVALQVLCEGARVKHSARNCPPKATTNAKGDCVDDSGGKVHEDCCQFFKECRAEVSDVYLQFTSLLEHYQSDCEMEEGDVHQDGAGAWLVVDDARICAEGCKVEEISVEDEELASALSSKCKDFPSMELELDVIALVRSLNIHRKTECQTATTTAAPIVNATNRTYWTGCGKFLPGAAKAWGQCEYGDRQLRSKRCGLFHLWEQALCENRTGLKGPYWNGRCAHCTNPSLAHAAPAGLIGGIGAVMLGVNPLGWAALAFAAAHMQTDEQCPPGYDAIDFRPCAPTAGSSSCEVMCLKNRTATSTAVL